MSRIQQATGVGFMALVLILAYSCSSSAPQASSADAGTPAPTHDAGSASSGDAGPTGVGLTDAGPTDAGLTDAGSADAGSTDAGSTDAGSTDAGSTDAGSTDAGSPAPIVAQVFLSSGDLKLPQAAVGHSLTLKTALAGQYVSAENGGGGALHANRATASGWETFTLIDLNGGELDGGDLVALRTNNGDYASAANGGGSTVDAHATTMAQWEIFEIRRIGGSGAIASGDQVAFATWDGQHFLSAVNGGGGDVVASATAVSGWEAFDTTIGPTTTRWLERQDDLPFTGNVPADAIGVDDAQTAQAVVGFGSSFTASSVWLLDQLPDTVQADALRALFDPANGIGLSAMRLPMGASDMMPAGAPFYTYDDVPSGQTDPNLAQFSIAPDLAHTVPLVQQALALQPGLSLVASPWSPPAWMKTSGSLIGGSLESTDAVRQAYAAYFVRFLQAYAAQGITIRDVTPQNEPLYEPTAYPGARSDVASEATFVGGYLGPALAQAGLTTGILSYDHNWDHPEYPLAVLADATAGRYATGAAFHCYAGSIDAQDQIHAAAPDKEVWLSECSAGNWETDPFGGKMWLLVEAMRHWASGVLLWNVALRITGGPAVDGGCTTCQGVLSVEEGRKVWMKGVQYFALAHFTRFLQPGAVRLVTNGGPADLHAVAFRNPDGTHVLVAWNGGSAAAAFSVAYRGRAFTATLEAGAAATFTW